MCVYAFRTLLIFHFNNKEVEIYRRENKIAKKKVLSYRIIQANQWLKHLQQETEIKRNERRSQDFDSFWQRRK